MAAVTVAFIVIVVVATVVAAVRGLGVRELVLQVTAGAHHGFLPHRRDGGSSHDEQGRSLDT